MEKYICSTLNLFLITQLRDKSIYFAWFRSECVQSVRNNCTYPVIPIFQASSVLIDVHIQLFESNQPKQKRDVAERNSCSVPF